MAAKQPIGALAAALILASGLAASGARAQVSAGGVDDAGMQSLLVGIGYQPTHLSKGLLIQLKRGTWTLYVQTVLSADGRKMGLNANLGEVTPDSVTAAQWKDLLVLNGDIEPSMFYFDATRNKLYMHRVLDNRGMSQAVLRTELDTFMDQVQSTSKTWSPITH